MNTFQALPAFSRAVVLLWALLLILYSLFNLLRALRLGKRSVIPALCAAVAAALLTGSQPLFQYHVKKRETAFDPPVWLLTAALLLFCAVCIALHFGVDRRMRDRITDMSVKESLDNLPAGLCCWFTGGLLKLVNTKMDALSKALCGRSVQNGDEFWAALQNGEYPGCLLTGEQPIYQTDDGAIWSFRCYPLLLEGEQVFELLAADVSQEYALTQTLEEKQRQAQRINTRLRSLDSAMDYLNMNRELLSLKVSLHDRLGQSLLYAKRYLAVPGSVDREELRDFWRLQVKLLKNESPEKWQNPYYVAVEQAERLGIALKINGELPREEALLSVVDTAITTHLTNVLRHAEGKTAYLRIEAFPDAYLLTFTNDGKPPAGPVAEVGGLNNLRRETQLLGGTMEIVSSPAFRMVLRLPKKNEGGRDDGV